MSKLDIVSYAMGKQGGGDSTTINAIVIHENGIYTAPTGTAYGTVAANVQPKMEYKEFTENGEYYATDDGYEAFDGVYVNVQPNVGDLYVTENGTYNAGEEGYDGYQSVVIEVPTPTPELQDKTVTANGTVTADDGYDGLSSVTVDVPQTRTGVEIPITGTQAAYLFYKSNSNPTYLVDYAIFHTDEIDISTSDLTDISGLFYNNANVVDTSWLTLNMKSNASAQIKSCFNGCTQIQTLPNVNGTNIAVGTSYSDYIFSNCHQLTSDSINSFMNHFSFSLLELGGDLSACYSLTTLPDYYSNCRYISYMYGHFRNCYALGEITGLKLKTYNYGSLGLSAFAFDNTSRLAHLSFNTEGAIGSMYSLTLDLTNYVGYAASADWITGYNSGLTTATQVTDDATYAALKNNSDWWTTDVNYSRYNHNSAVETLCSLPTVSTSGATIKFLGASGASTDGGAISNLTEEEIAIATACNWTVSIS